MLYCIILYCIVSHAHAYIARGFQLGAVMRLSAGKRPTPRPRPNVKTFIFICIYIYICIYICITTLYISLKEYVFSANAKTVKSEEFAKLNMDVHCAGPALQVFPESPDGQP